MIVSLRNPIERAYSSYKGHVLAGLVEPGEDIEAASARIEFDNQSRMIEHGFYHQHLQRYLQYFRRDQFLILIFEDLKDDPRAFIRAIYRFLDVDEHFEPEKLRQRVNESFQARGVSTSVVRGLNRMGRWLRPIWPNAHRRYEQGVRLIRNRIVKKENTEVPPEVRTRLSAIYREHNEQLAEFLGRDLSIWR
jgi:hypothetical protein